MTNALARQHAFHRAQPIELLAAFFAARRVRLNEGDVGGVELTIDERAQQQFLINAGGHHFTLLCSSAALPGGSNSLASIARPRASRDITVPTGTPVTSAISA